MSLKTKSSLLALALTGVLAAGCGESEKKENGGVVEKVEETITEKTVETKQEAPAEVERHSEVAPVTEVAPVQEPVQNETLAPDQTAPVQETAPVEVAPATPGDATK